MATIAVGRYRGLSQEREDPRARSFHADDSYLAHLENKFGKYARDRAVRRPYRLKVRASDCQSLSDRQRAAADFLQVVSADLLARAP